VNLEGARTARADARVVGRLWSTDEVLADRPSLTALGVALARARLDRPTLPTGDATADRVLAESLLADAPDEIRSRAGARRSELGGAADAAEAWHVFGTWIGGRTTFFDDAVLRAIADGRTQIVILGAGYDVRACRFRTPGVRYIEVDHPATQGDKRRRLDQLGIATEDITFVAADFITDDLDTALDAGGHRRERPTTFLLEGVLRYLPERSFRGLLATIAARAAARSELAVSISTRDPGNEDPNAERRLARERQLADSGEAVLTVPPRKAALTWVAEAGWTIESVVEAGGPDGRRGRLLVLAHP
jgi:methyltransferase (TIGR00027 family)